LGRKAASQLGAIVFLAAISFAASAFIMNRTWDACDWIRDSREVQLQIDRFVWDLTMLQQSTRAHALNPDSERARRFSRLRDCVRDDLARTARLIGNKPYLQQRVADLSAAFAVYLGNLEQIFAKGAGVEGDPNRALALTADVTRVSGLITQIREHEDRVLAQRTSRADTLFSRCCC
jgi:hypothetical protein